MAANMQDILDRQSNTVERPKPLPVGPYIWSITGVPTHGKSKQKQTPFVEFVVKPLQAGEEVDPDDLQAALTRLDGNNKALGDQTKRLTFYLTEDALWRLTNFLDDCKAGDDTMSIRQRIENTPGCQFIGVISHSVSDDGEAVFANITKTMPTD